MMTLGVMTLDTLMRQLIEIRNKPGVNGDSLVFVEGHDEEGNFIQRAIESVTTEARCEDEDVPQAIYINLEDEEE